MREVFWKQGSPFPEPVWRALLFSGAVSMAAGLWALSANRPDFFWDMAVVLGFSVLFYKLAIAPWPAEHRAAAASGDFSKRAVVGFSLRHGPNLIVYGLLGWLALFLFANLPNWFLGVPEYAYSMESAFAVVGVAPLREEVLLAAFWSLLYSALPRWKFWGATLAAAILFTGLHGATYAGASEFAFLQLFLMRVVFAGINWLPTLRGHPPSMVPAWIAHTSNNAFWYALTCVAGTGLQAALATRLC